MLVRFDSKVGTITMFGDVAKKLLRMMGQSGSVPGAILAADIPQAIKRLRSGVGLEPPPSQSDERNASETPINLSQRAFPLIELLELASKKNADVIWEEEHKAI